MSAPGETEGATEIEVPEAEVATHQARNEARYPSRSPE